MDIFVLLIISGFAYLLPKNSRDYLNPASTNGLKGILAIGINTTSFITRGYYRGCFH